jgi:hypothetical protein
LHVYIGFIYGDRSSIFVVNANPCVGLVLQKVIEERASSEADDDASRRMCCDPGRTPSVLAVRGLPSDKADQVPLAESGPHDTCRSVMPRVLSSNIRKWSTICLPASMTSIDTRLSSSRLVIYSSIQWHPASSAVPRSRGIA